MDAKAIVRSVVQLGRRALEPVSLAARNCMGAVTAVETDDPVVALTFDDGPHRDYTPALLSLLAKQGARATFFIIGELAQKHADIVRAAAAAGHAIGNHSWSHLSLPLLTARERREQIQACEQVLQPYGQKLFRPPYCHLSLHSRWDLLCAGYEVVAFSVHAEDWLDREADWMADQLIRRIRCGSIVILHDNIYHSVLPRAQHDRRPMLHALESVLKQLKSYFQFVTVPELLSRGRPVREHWYRKGPRELEPALRAYLLEHRASPSMRTS